MTEAEALKTIADWLQEQHNIETDRVQMETSIVDDLKLDSLDEVELVMALEERFQIDVADEIAREWKIIGDVVRFLVALPVATQP